MENLIFLVSLFPILETIFFVIFNYAAQARRCFKTKSSIDISISAVVTAVIANVCWVIYGIFYCETLYVVGAAITTIAALVVMLIVFHFRKKNKTSEIAHKAHNQ